MRANFTRCRTVRLSRQVHRAWIPCPAPSRPPRGTSSWQQPSRALHSCPFHRLHSLLSPHSPRRRSPQPSRRPCVHSVPARPRTRLRPPSRPVSSLPPLPNSPLLRSSRLSRPPSNSSSPHSFSTPVQTFTRAPSPWWPLKLLRRNRSYSLEAHPHSYNRRPRLRHRHRRRHLRSRRPLLCRRRQQPQPSTPNSCVCRLFWTDSDLTFCGHT